MAFLNPNRPSYRWVLLAVAFITLVLGYAIRNCFAVFFPAIVEEFGWQRGNTALIFSFSIIVYGLIAPLAGGLVDRFSPRVVIPVGALIMGGGVALCSRATSPWEFYLIYGVLVATGLSLAGWTPLTTIVSKWFDKRRGLAIGIMTAGFGGSLVYASIAQYLITTFGWQKAYVIIGVSSAGIIIPLCVFFMRQRPRHMDRMQDERENSTAGSGNPANIDAPPLQSPLERKWVETTWTLPLALKTHQFWLICATGFWLLGIAEHIAIAHQVYFFRDVGYPPMLAANIYSTFGLAFVLGDLISFSSDRFGREAVYMPGCLLCILAVVLLLFIEDSSRPWMGFVFALMFGVGMGIAAPVFFTIVSDLFLGQHFGSILGSIILAFSLGGAVAPWLGGFLHDQSGSYFSTYLLLIGSLLLSMVLMWLVAPGKIRPIARHTA